MYLNLSLLSQATCLLDLARFQIHSQVILRQGNRTGTIFSPVPKGNDWVLGAGCGAKVDVGPTGARRPDSEQTGTVTKRGPILETSIGRKSGPDIRGADNDMLSNDGLLLQ